ncbi:hypothetical protein SARC_03566 [Sphaeroforma arctica JP610]|uniref:tetrahydrofolate synthase n=1 Tax=Sphaeroforma arctica JP610 TaxID=667725 RepID=A0A0L0G598_9EUKA|nr:hypothetical protein SARC_03566 [Sphaeroforma arctica JP610]KNC84205.1 hypothetical protein SARC_03566 [Sphaeroforma arctica JP610]|eukprot:XP_014158107.1 hypothetical protein SARC_03566 [Sphaeroforma arctica JP610]
MLLSGFKHLPAEKLDNLHAIHVSGTKGKGSTCAFSESILRHNGHTTGLYTSPHLVEVRERIRINGKPLTREAFADRFFEVWDQLQQQQTTDLGMPSYFHFLTILAFHTFLAEKVDVAIIECGVGGSFDSTNVLAKPWVCAVSPLGLDHTQTLGDTMQLIARHKAGIFKPRVPAVSIFQSDETAALTLQAYAKHVKAVYSIANPLHEYTSESEPLLTLGLEGTHQQQNAALALAATGLWLRRHRGESELTGGSRYGERINPYTFREPQAFISQQTLKGLRDATFPGRSMTYRSQGVTYYLDGAHTLESMQCAAEWMRSLDTPVNSKRYLLFNCMKRDPVELLKPVLDLHRKLAFDGVLFCPNITYHTKQHADTTNHNQHTENQLAASKLNASIWTDLCNQAQVLTSSTHGKVRSFESIEQAVRWVHSPEASGACPGTHTEDVRVFVCGSLHLVGGVLANVGYGQ